MIDSWGHTSLSSSASVASLALQTAGLLLNVVLGKDSLPSSQSELQHIFVGNSCWAVALCCWVGLTATQAGLGNAGVNSHPGLYVFVVFKKGLTCFISEMAELFGHNTAVIPCKDPCMLGRGSFPRAFPRASGE